MVLERLLGLDPSPCARSLAWSTLSLQLALYKTGKNNSYFSYVLKTTNQIVAWNKSSARHLCPRFELFSFSCLSGVGGSAVCVCGGGGSSSRKVARQGLWESCQPPTSPLAQDPLQSGGRVLHLNHLRAEVSPYWDLTDRAVGPFLGAQNLLPHSRQPRTRHMS